MKELAKQCIEHVGGAANIQAVSHCATRLRLTLRDQSQVNEAALTALPEVIKVMQVGVQTQIIIGSDAPELYGVVSQLVEQAQSEAPAKSAEALRGNSSMPAAVCLLRWCRRLRQPG